MSRFAAFVQERRYLKNVSPSTVSWYTHAFKWLPSESPSQEELKDTVLRMREKGLKETGYNAAILAINAYLHWNSGSERKCGAGCNHLRISQLKEPQNILPTLTAAQIERIVSWKPRSKNFYQRRLHLLTKGSGNPEAAENADRGLPTAHLAECAGRDSAVGWKCPRRGFAYTRARRRSASPSGASRIDR